MQYWERPGDQPLPQHRLAAPVLAAAFGAFKREGARGNYTHTPQPRARADDEHPSLLRALRRGAARHARDAPAVPASGSHSTTAGGGAWSGCL